MRWPAALFALAAAPVVGAAAGGGAISFGVTAPYVKVAEGGVGLNGAWERNIAVNGSEVDLGEGNVTSASEYEVSGIRTGGGAHMGHTRALHTLPFGTLTVSS